jgi:hypothetical protein
MRLSAVDDGGGNVVGTISNRQIGEYRDVDDVRRDPGAFNGEPG